MDKAFLAKQLEIVKNLPAGQTFPFTLEGAGALGAFVKARANRPDISDTEKALHKKIIGLLKSWTESGSSPKSTSLSDPEREKRTQLVLRVAIDKVSGDEIEKLSSAEVKLLKATHAIFTRKSDSGDVSNPRLAELLENTLDSIEKNKDRLLNADADSIFESTGIAEESTQDDRIVNSLVADKVLGDIKTTAKSKIEEIDLEINVRVFEYTGNTHIDGDIPNDVFIKVKNGSLSVDGFVSGYLAADNDIRIEGNIQGGGAISNYGSIELERSLMGAVLVSKRGNITCEHLEGPRVVFAWETLTVKGPCMAGPITAGQMKLEGKVVSATLHSCGHIEAAAFDTSSRDDTVIYLSTHIKCDEYHREISDHLDRKYSRITELNRKIKRAEESDAFLLNYINNLYRTGLFFLLGGVESASTATTASELQGRQIRGLYLGQIISFAKGVSKFYAEALENPKEIDRDTVEDYDYDNRDMFTSLKDEIESIPIEFGETHQSYLSERLGELKYLIRAVHAEYMNGKEMATLKEAFPKRLNQWLSDQHEIARIVSQMIEKFGLDEEVLERIEHEPDKLEDMLNETMTRLEKSSDPKESMRAASPLIRLLRRSAERSLRSMENSVDDVRKYRKELKNIIETLEREAAVKLAPQVPSATLVRAGRFASDVIITASPVARRGRDTTLAKVIVLAEDIEKETTFVLLDRMIQRLVS